MSLAVHLCAYHGRDVVGFKDLAGKPPRPTRRQPDAVEDEVGQDIAVIRCTRSAHAGPSEARQGTGRRLRRWKSRVDPELEPTFSFTWKPS